MADARGFVLWSPMPSGYRPDAFPAEPCTIIGRAPDDAPHHMSPKHRYDYIVRLASGLRVYATTESLTKLPAPPPLEPKHD